MIYFFFFFNDTATTEIYTLSLHDALPISARAQARLPHPETPGDELRGSLCGQYGANHGLRSAGLEDTRTVRLAALAQKRVERGTSVDQDASPKAPYLGRAASTHPAPVPRLQAKLPRPACGLLPKPAPVDVTRQL